MVRIPLSEASLPCLDSLSLKLPSAFSCGFQNLCPEPTFIIWMCWPLFLLLLCPGSQGSNSLQSPSSCLLQVSDTQREVQSSLDSNSHSLLSFLLALLTADESLQNPYSSRRLPLDAAALMRAISNQRWSIQPGSASRLQHLPVHQLLLWLRDIFDMFSAAWPCFESPTHTHSVRGLEMCGGLV